MGKMKFKHLALSLVFLVGICLVGAAKPTAQGPYHSYDHYVSVTSRNYTTWSSFNWKKRQTTKALYQQTLLAKGYYKHQNGSTYYSLYQQNGQWCGYVNAHAVTVATGSQGIKYPVDRYVALSKRGYPLWHAFFNHQVGSTTANYQKTYHVTGVYHAANGGTYDSLYDTAGHWYGYVNAAATKTVSGIQGSLYTDNRYVTLTNASYGLWHGFFKNATHAKYGTTYHVTGHYNAANGVTYLSLFDHNGKWQGDVNQAGVTVGKGTQGAWLPDHAYVKLTQPNYPLWPAFFHGSKTTTTQRLNQTYLATGQYHVLNGATYLSLYDVSSHWLGYVNAQATKTVNATPVSGFTLSAHRGDHTKAPEDSLQALQQAAADGYGLSEVDVQATADHQLVLMHDQTIDRTTDGTGKVSALSMSEIEKAALDVTNYPDYAGQHLTVPSFEAVAQAVGQTSMGLNLDGSKGAWSDPSFVAPLVSQLKATGLYQRSFFVLSDASVRAAFMKQYPDARVTWLYSPSQSIEVTLMQLQRYPHSLLTISNSQVTPGIIALMRASGMAIHVYGVNDVATAQNLKQAGVNYVETDTVLPSQLQ